MEVNGNYTVTNASVCWHALEPGQAAVAGSNLFDQVPIVFDGRAGALHVGGPTAMPVQWSVGSMGSVPTVGSARSVDARPSAGSVGSGGSGDARRPPGPVGAAGAARPTGGV